MKSDYSVPMIVIAAFIIVGLIIVGPLLILWSMNTLFPVLAIPYDIWTWLAVTVLFGAVRANVSVKSKS
jgi:hypothetical protein